MKLNSQPTQCKKIKSKIKKLINKKDPKNPANSVSPLTHATQVMQKG